MLVRIPRTGALRLVVQRKSECNVRRRPLQGSLNNYCASTSTFSSIPCQFRYPALLETCVTVREQASMRSVRDSFDSDLESLHDISSGDVVAKNPKKTSPRENEIPKVLAGGFKKASELLRDIEAAGLGTDTGFDVKDDSTLTKVSRTRRQAKDNAKPQVKANKPQVKKRKSSSMLNAETDEKPTVHTSCHFPNEATMKKHAQLGNTVLETENQAAQAQHLLQNGKEALNETYSFNPMEDLRLGVTPTVLNDELELGNDIAMPIAVKGHQKHKAIEDEHNDFPTSDSLLLTTNTTTVSPVRTTIDLTSDPSLVDLDQDSASQMASIVEKYIYRAQDSTTGVSDRPAESVTNQKTNQSTAANHNLGGPILNKAVSPIKKKSPAKKKQLTVTEKALVEFQPEEVSDSLPLQEYFPVVGPKKQADETKKTSRAKPRTKTTGKARKPEKKSSLLAPVDALQTLHDQQLMFGTSSQLLQHSSSPNHPENKPVQAACAPTPNLRPGDSFVDIDFFLENSSNMLGLKSTRSLWSAATRDGDGTLMNMEIAKALDDPGNPVAVRGPTINLTEPTSKPEVQDQEFNSEETNEPIMPASLNVSKDLPPIVKSIPVLPRSLGEAATKQRQTSRSPVKKKRKIKDLVVKPEDAFKKVAVADLKAELKSFGCKPPRSKAKMVELLLECRANQNKLQDTETEALQLQSIPDPEPQLSITTSTTPQDLSNINLDPAAREAPVLDSSQSKRKRTQLENAATDSSSDNMPPPSFQIPPEDDEGHEQLDQIEVEALMSGIHQAIMTQPPTHSTTNPSWKEKMAMYDPIVLEELTAWLNTGGLDAVGIDTEVWPALVRDWCESKSVCFIWTTEGWRKKRS